MDRDKLVEAWKRYGETYNVFVPAEQPTPKGEGWDRPLPGEPLWLHRACENGLTRRDVCGLWLHFQRTTVGRCTESDQRSGRTR